MLVWQLHGQVDNKFILCSLRLDDRKILCAFDQHAVHERVRLEDLENVGRWRECVRGVPMLVGQVCYHTKDERQSVEFKPLSEPYRMELDGKAFS